MTLIGQAVLLVEGMRARSPRAAPRQRARPDRPPAPRRPDGRPADRPLDLPGGVRLRRAPVPLRARAGAARRRRLGGPGLRPPLDRPRGRPRRRRLLHRRPRRHRPDRRHQVFGETAPHLPLYLAEAACVELAGLALARRPLALGAASGLAIGTVGFAAEWGWSQIAMPIPWTSDLLPEALIVAIVAARRGRPGRRAARAARSTGRLPRRADRPQPFPIVALLAIMGVFVDGLWTTGPQNIQAQRDAPRRTSTGRSARSAPRCGSIPLRPPRTPPGSTPPRGRAAAWSSTGWRPRATASTARPSRSPSTATGRRRSGSSEAARSSACPSTCPSDAAIPGPRGCRRSGHFTRPFVADHQLLQREQKPGRARLADDRRAARRPGARARLPGQPRLGARPGRAAHRRAAARAATRAGPSPAGDLRPHGGQAVSAGIPLQETTLHGHRVGFRMAGDGPLIVLIHGITSTSDVWVDVMARLAERYTVVAPDLLGHGRSAKPRGDYSLGAYASGARDLLGLLGFERGTVVGPLARRRNRAPVRLPVPRVLRAAGARFQRRARQGGPPAAASGGASGLRAGACRSSPRAGRFRARGRGRRVPPALRRAGRPRPGRGGARLRLAGRPRRPSGVPAHTAGGHRPRGPARERDRPPVPGRAASHPADLGHERPDHPGRATGARRSSGSPAAAWSSSPGPGTGPSSTTRIASSPS